MTWSVISKHFLDKVQYWKYLEFVRRLVRVCAGHGYVLLFLLLLWKALGDVRSLRARI